MPGSEVQIIAGIGAVIVLAIIILRRRSKSASARKPVAGRR